MAAAAAGAPVGAPGRSASSISVDTFADPLTGAPVSVTNVNGEESYSLGATPTAQSGIAGFLGSPAVSALVNTGLSLAVPGYAPANAVSLLGTGTSLYGQAHSLATGQGFQTGGGIMGLMGGTGGFGPSVSPSASIGESSGGGGTYGGDIGQVSTEVIRPVQQAAAQKTVPQQTYDISNFIANNQAPLVNVRRTDQYGRMYDLPLYYSDYTRAGGYRPIA
jgi:hypothetical protein